MKKIDMNPQVLLIKINDLEHDLDRTRKELFKKNEEIKELEKIINSKTHYKKKYRLYEIYKYSKTHKMYETLKYFECSKSTYYRAIRTYEAKKVSKP